ncbi:uncharacterized protein DS421_1g02920 [Arachis hypogaea]|nr:uncharacterized protein DS421_1g02920 [Arachis hypogaea]
MFPVSVDFSLHRLMPGSGSVAAFLRRLVLSSSSSSGAGLRGGCLFCHWVPLVLSLGPGSWSWMPLVLLLDAVGSAAGSCLLGATGSAVGFCLVEFRVLQFTLASCGLVLLVQSYRHS